MDPLEHTMNRAYIEARNKIAKTREKQLAEAVTEIERLRKGLEEIAEGAWRPGTDPRQIISDMRTTARNTLANQQKGPT